MFDNIQNALEALSRTGQLEFKIDTDEKGYIDRECPAPRCLYRFKVKDSIGAMKDATTLVCPMCGHRESANHWHTTDQVKQAEKLALRRVEGLIDDALRSDAQAFNRRQPSGGFLKMSMQVRGAQPFSSVNVPISAAAAMQLEIECEACKTQYAVLGSGFFCPGCGHSSAERVFDDALRKIAAKKDHLAEVRDAIEKASGADQAALVTRSLIESCLLDGVVAFQRFCEAVYQRLPGAAPPSFNVFQRLDDGSQLWQSAVGERYEDWLEVNELLALKTLFQRRHLLAHSDGLVDEKYLAKTGDQTYQVGQRIGVTEDDVDEFVAALKKLTAGIRSVAPHAH